MSHENSRRARVARTAKRAANRDRMTRVRAARVPPRPDRGLAGIAEDVGAVQRGPLGHLVYLPIPLFLVAVAVLWLADLPGRFDPPLLLMSLNFVFSTLVSLFVAYLIARSFLVCGTPGLLMLGCGVVVWGLAGVAAVAAGRSDTNVIVTVHNICVCLSGACHLSGAFFSLRPERTLRAPGMAIAAGYAGALGAVVLIALAAVDGRIPTFFVQGYGGTPLRQLVLASAVGMFVLTAVLLGGPNSKPLSAFRYWYTLALALIATGLLGVMTERSHGNLVSWAGRMAQFLSGVYMLVAAIAAVRESHVWGITLGEALRESEKRFKVLAAATFEGIAITEAGRFIDANEQLLAMLGYSREELIGMSVADVTATTDRERVMRHIQGGRESLIEAGGMRKDGTRIVIEAHGRTLQYHNRKVRITAVRDITQRKRAEQALRESRARYRMLLDQAPDAVLVTQDGRIVYCNAAALRLYGAERPAQLLGKERLDIVHPAQREEVRARIRGVLEGQEPPLREFRHLRLDGVEVPVETTGVRVEWQGRPAVQAMIRDVSERNLVERRVHRQNSLLAGISRILHEALTCESEQELGRTCLAVAEELTESRLSFIGEIKASRRLGEIAISDCGWSACRLQGHEGRPSSKDMDIHGLYGRVVLSNQGFFTNDPAAHPDSIGLPPGHPPLTAFLGVPLTRGGKVLGLVALGNREGGYRTEDLEAMQALAPVMVEALMHKRAEAALREAKAAAEHANAAKDQFLAVLSHELRTPLTPLLLAACLLERRGDLPPGVQSELQAMRRSIELEARIIDDLLDLTRIVRGKLQFVFRKVDLHVLVRAAADICGRGEGAEVQLDLAARSHFVNGDAARLQQLFWNLLNNARKFTPADGRITVRSCDLPNGRICVAITDTGAGIEAEALPRIFEAFEQGDICRGRQFGGLGLGLAICNAVTEAHGGKISAASAGHGCGAEFTVEIPTVAPSDGDVAAGGPVSTEARLARSLRVLVVDDHAATLEVISRLVQDLGHRVETAADLKSAMRIADQGQVDLLISDLGLPDGSGYDLMRRLQDRPGVRGIAISGYGMEQDVRRSKEAGFTEHLIKPVDLGVLEALVSRIAMMGDASPPPA
jgi:PAS domain S-box-containing protein